MMMKTNVNIIQSKYINTQTIKIMKGYVYILTNPSFKDNVIKIGKAIDVDARINGLDKTGLPTKFEKYAMLKTSKYETVEDMVHRILTRLTNYRVRENREFYHVSPELALEVLRDINIILDDGEIVEFQTENETEEITSSGKRRPAFKFHMAKIDIGEKVIFTPDDNDETRIEVTVVSDDKVEYEGRQYSLSYFTKAFMPESKRNNSESYQGPKYFTYKGKTLIDLREEFENK